TTALALSPSVTTSQVSTSTLTLGPAGAVSDRVTVQGTPAGSPSGTVNVYVCHTGAAAGACAPLLTNHFSALHLTAGAGNTAGATSGAFFPTATGTWCFSASYAGDSLYAGSADNTMATNLDAHECATVTPSPSAITSFVSSPAITLGDTVTDSVSMVGNIAGGSPAGAVTFYVCHTSVTTTPTPGPCPAAGAGTTAALLPGAFDTSSTVSGLLVPTSVGTWCVAALYGGSATYAPSADNTTTANVDANECTLVAPGSSDAITSDAHASAVAGSLFSFSVTTSGSPLPSIKKKGKLPRGVRFRNNHDGTATISGTPKGPGTGLLTFDAVFGRGKGKHVVSQAFILTVL
ncbi:MAG: hypothetical protein ACRDOE_01235, partial [Streptosporangiaceae bacterium]